MYDDVMIDEHSPEVLFLNEVASLLRLPVTTLRAWARNGRLPAVKIGRRYLVRRVDLNRLLDPASVAMP